MLELEKWVEEKEIELIYTHFGSTKQLNKTVYGFEFWKKQWNPYLGGARRLNIFPDVTRKEYQQLKYVINSSKDYILTIIYLFSA